MKVQAFALTIACTFIIFIGGVLLMFNAIIELLRSNGSIVVNKNLTKAVGLEEAVIYSELLSRFLYFKERNQLTTDGWFFNTIEDLEDGTTLNEYTQRKAIKHLEEIGLIQTQRRDIPAKRYFKIVEDERLITNLICKNSSTSSLNFKELDLENLSTNNTNINNTKNNTNSLGKPKQTVNQPLINPNTKKTKLAKKVKDDATMKGMIYSFTQNEEIQDKLFEYYSIRSKKDLVPTQWQVILHNLREATNGNTDTALELINNAIAGGYRQIVYTKGGTQAPHKQARFDNTAGRDVQAVATMSEQEKREFEQNLAKDEHGNLLKF